MKNQTIKLIIANKLRWWATSIENAEVKKAIEENAILTGGAIVSLLQNEQPKDFDFYFRTADAAEKVARYYVELERKKNGAAKKQFDVIRDNDRVKIMVKSAGAVDNVEDEEPPFEDDGNSAVVQEAAEAAQAESKKDEKPRYRVLFMSANAITLSDGVQVVLRFTGEPDEIHENYDFVHCTSFYTAWDRKLTLRPEAVLAILQKELIYVGSKYPVCSIIRVRKFVKRGWTITAGQMLKMIFQCRELDLGDIKVLEDQLTGVDTTYFQILLNAIGLDRSNGQERKIDSLYICELIDRILK